MLMMMWRVQLHNPEGPSSSYRSDDLLGVDSAQRDVACSAGSGVMTNDTQHIHSVRLMHGDTICI